MIGRLDHEVIEKFKEFQEQTGKHAGLYIEDVEFERIELRQLHQKDRVTTVSTTSENKFIEIGDIDKITKKYNIEHKIKPNMPKKGKHAPEGTILISRVRPLLGGYTIIDGDDYIFTSGDLNPIVLPNNICVQYIFKIICSPLFEKFVKENQNTSGQKPTITDQLYNFKIPIPKDLNNSYYSYKIQEAIVEFLEYLRENLTDLERNRISKKRIIYQKIRELVVKNTFKNDLFLIKAFKQYASTNNYTLSLDTISFKEVDFFTDKQKDLLLPKKLEKNQQLVLKNAQDDGVAVYTGGKDILCRVDKNKYIDKIFIPNKNNPDISFANNGDGSAGRNFFMHTEPYFVNQERTVITFKNDENYFSKYIYYFIQDMRYKYNMNRDRRPTPKDLPGFGIKIMLPQKCNMYSSKEIQKILVDFWENFIDQIDYQMEIFDRIEDVSNKIDKAFIYRTFSKIEWR